MKWLRPVIFLGPALRVLSNAYWVALLYVRGHPWSCHILHVSSWVFPKDYKRTAQLPIVPCSLHPCMYIDIKVLDITKAETPNTQFSNVVIIRK